jgi:hypothetical protein
MIEEGDVKLMSFYFGNGDLEFRQYTIKRVYDAEDRCGNDCTYIDIRTKDGWGAELDLYDNDLKLLLGLLNCTKEELVGKKIISVVCDVVHRAIGYGGYYFRLYYRGNSSKLLSLDELCTSLNNFKITALDEDDKVIDMDTLLMQSMGRPISRFPMGFDGASNFKPKEEKISNIKGR